VVAVKVKALPNARSNETLGVERAGSGVVIDKGLVLTIGYLILEADTVEVVDSRGKSVPAAVVAYDHASGLGLLRPVAQLSAKPIRIGTSAPVAQLERLLVVSGGSDDPISLTVVVSRRQFAGYWEYLIDGAIFTAPPRLDHSGAALINSKGELVGIGSLFVQDTLAKAFYALSLSAEGLLCDRRSTQISWALAQAHTERQDSFPCSRRCATGLTNRRRGWRAIRTSTRDPKGNR
jgi:S1-C subfamily serine protease